MLGDVASKVLEHLAPPLSPPVRVYGPILFEYNDTAGLNFSDQALNIRQWRVARDPVLRLFHLEGEVITANGGRPHLEWRRFRSLTDPRPALECLVRVGSKPTTELKIYVTPVNMMLFRVAEMDKVLDVLEHMVC